MHTNNLPSRSRYGQTSDRQLFTARTGRRLLGGLAVCLLAGLIVGSQCIAPPDGGDPDGDPPTPTEVTLFTTMGNITIQLLPEQAPEAVAKFLELIDDEDYYDGKIFHEATSTALFAGAYDVQLKDGQAVTFVNESNNGLKNTRGRVALYGPTDQTSGKPQFLINVGENRNFDYSLNSATRPPYTVIGRVTQGLDVVDRIAGLATFPGTSSGGTSLQRIPETDEGHRVRIFHASSQETEAPANTDPIADAGDDQVVEPQSKVTLDGSRSSDPDGDPLFFEWSLTEASQQALDAANLTLTLDKADTANPTFTAPAPDQPLDVVFELRVTDDRGAGSTATVTVTLGDNITPVANAGADQTAHPGDNVQLDGSGSNDPDDGTLTYNWSLTAESAQLLSDLGLPAPSGATTVKYTFAAPNVTAPLPLVFELTVTDDKGAQDTDSVEVRILPISFNTAVSYTVGGQPVAIAAGDFDGDSHPDIAVVKAATNQVAVLFNDGEGALLDPVLYAVGDSPESIVVADFNGDGLADIAAATRNDSRLWVLLNNGDGTFATPTSYPMGSGPVSLATAQIEGNGLDVAAVNTTGASNNSLAVLINDGTGVFPGGQPNLSIVGKDDQDNIITPVGARVLAAGNVDSDGQTDLVVAYADRKVFVLLGDSTVTDGFRFGSHFEAGTSGVTDPRDIILSDLTGDSQLDVVVALKALNQVSVRKNNGGGRFGFEALYETGTGPAGLAAADLDGDGDVDLAVANESANTVSILQNRGAASFRPKVDLPLVAPDAGPVGLVAVDLNSDDAIDLVVVNRVSGTVSVLLNLTVSVDAGEDQDVLVGESVTLRGIAKSLEGAVFTYHWTQTDGPAVDLSDPAIAEPTFTAPNQTGSLIFRLTATDDQGATATDTVRVDVYIQTSSGLKYCDAVRGTGAVVQPNSTVAALYTGRLDNRAGSTFDTTAPQNEPREFSLSGLIVGWQEGLGNYDMRVGGTRLLIIPPELGYGSTPRQGIPANSTLWFEIEVLDAN